MEQWARDWLEGERAKGVKRLEIKVKGRNHYVYESTTHWDKVIQKRVKTSQYLGKLDHEKGLIKSRGMNNFDDVQAPSVTEYGNSMLLRLAMEDLKPLLMSAFPANWEAIYALSMIRTDGNVPLKRSKVVWEKLHNPDSIMPNMNPGAVSKLLRTIGVNREGQDIVFQGILDRDDIRKVPGFFGKSDRLSGLHGVKGQELYVVHPVMGFVETPSCFRKSGRIRRDGGGIISKDSALSKSGRAGNKEVLLELLIPPDLFKEIMINIL